MFTRLAVTRLFRYLSSVTVPAKSGDWPPLILEEPQTVLTRLGAERDRYDHHRSGDEHAQ